MACCSSSASPDPQKPSTSESTRSFVIELVPMMEYTKGDTVELYRSLYRTAVLYRNSFLRTVLCWYRCLYCSLQLYAWLRRQQDFTALVDRRHTLPLYNKHEERGDIEPSAQATAKFLCYSFGILIYNESDCPERCAHGGPSSCCPAICGSGACDAL